MFNGKMKAITLSYDDGVCQDRRLVEIFNKYNLKATFNINTERLGQKGSLEREGVTVQHNKISPDEVKKLYDGHEVAVHTLTHPNLENLTDDEVIRQVEEDRKNIEALVGYDVVGMAYPGGNFDDRVVRLLAENTKIKYSRTVIQTNNFDVQTDLLRFNPTVYHLAGMDTLYGLAEEFFNKKTSVPQIFYIWGHSYEFDYRNTWDEFEEFCKFIANRDDIFYGTNAETLLP